MLARKSCPFEKAIHTVKTNHMVECTITMWEKQVIEIKINIVDIKVTVEENSSNMEVQQHKDNSMENLKEVPFTKNPRWCH